VNLPVSTAPVTVMALDEGWTDTAEAEHGALAGAAVLGRTVVSACTHVAAGPDGVPRVVVTLEVAGRAPAGAQVATPALAAQVTAHADRAAGRAFRFPGWQALTGVLTVAELAALGAIDEVAVVGGPAPADDALVDTQEFVRPVYRGGRLVLHLRPAAGGYVPFEQPDPIPCCTDHVVRPVGVRTTEAGGAGGR
jgi:hypothetical protein